MNRFRRIANRVGALVETIYAVDGLTAAKFDTRKEMQVYKREHDLNPGTKLELRTKQEMKERAKDKKASFGDRTKVEMPGLQEELENVRMPTGRFVVKFRSPEVKRFVDKGMKEKGFGSRKEGRGNYGSDHWDKGGKSWRVYDLEDDVLILEEFNPA